MWSYPPKNKGTKSSSPLSCFSEASIITATLSGNRKTRVRNKAGKVLFHKALRSVLKKTALVFVLQRG